MGTRLRKNKFSVCIATYNGERYIKEQLDSILANVTQDDEIIVSDDGSTDSTLVILESYKHEFANFIVLNGPQHGFSSNFNNAVINAKKDIIVFSDQDDIWKPHKLDVISECFDNDIMCTTVLHDMSTFRKDCMENTKEIEIIYNKGAFRNFIKSSYWGCCMAVKREFLDSFLPFRDYCVGHDQLVGLMTELFGKCKFVPLKLINHRLHTSNTSKKKSIGQMFSFRIRLLRDLLYAYRIAKTYNYKFN